MLERGHREVWHSCLSRDTVKPTKLHMTSVKTQISCIYLQPNRSAFHLKKLWVLVTCVPSEGSDHTAAMPADLSLCWRHISLWPGHLAQSGVSLIANQEVAGLSSSQATYFCGDIYHEVISMVILPLPLIQEGQISVSGKSMCTKYWLTAEKGCVPRNSVARLTDHRYMAEILLLWCKIPTQTNTKHFTLWVLLCPEWFQLPHDKNNKMTPIQSDQSLHLCSMGS